MFNWFKRKPKMNVTMYAIREHGTNNFLPEINGRGNSFVNPTPIDKSKPRLFPQERNARIALSHWRKGELHTDRSDLGNEHTTLKPRPDRLVLNMVVVPVFMEIPA